MGYEGGTTPFLDDLAEDGVVFENAFATGPTTTQSMPGLMTGTYPSWFGGYPPIPESQTTLAEAFSNAGYTTVGIHSNPWLHPSHRFDAGFDVYVDMTEEKQQGSRPEPKEGKTNSKKPLDAAKGRILDTLKSAYYEFPSSLRRVVSQSYFTYHYLFGRANDTAEMAVDRAIEAIDEEGTDDFFLWIHFMDVHRPYTLPAGPDTDIWQTARITQPSYTNPTSKDQEHISQIYDQSVAYVDSQIERLYQKFKRRGVDEETVFVLTSDHGEEFGEHGDWFHRSFKLYDELLHVPLLMAGPSVQSERFTGLTSLTDVAPTVLEFAGIESPKLMSGNSMERHLREGDEPERKTVVGEIYDPNHDRAAVRSERWKIICDRNENRTELYDIEADPDETQNLATEHDQPKAIQQGLREYLSRRERAKGAEIETDIENRLKGLGYLE
jgi:arylsulfatase A-like enzyme